MSVFGSEADINSLRRHFHFVPCVDGSLLARVYLNDAALLVGAAMCSAY
jgi:hypothetical protein